MRSCDRRNRRTNAVSIFLRSIPGMAGDINEFRYFRLKISARGSLVLKTMPNPDRANKTLNQSYLLYLPCLIFNKPRSFVYSYSPLYFLQGASPLSGLNNRAAGYFEFQIWRMKLFQVYRRIIVGSLDCPAAWRLLLSRLLPVIVCNRCLENSMGSILDVCRTAVRHFIRAIPKPADSPYSHSRRN